MSEPIKCLTAANLAHADGVRHGFFGRQGGVSSGIYASLNCGPGSGDNPDAVRENRNRALEALLQGDSGELATLYQVHSARTLTVETVWPAEERPQADSMVTNRPGIALGILTADCAPVLFADPVARVIGAAHAGWKGALSGVTNSVLAAMEKLGAHRARIAASIGPCISQAAYEVGPEFRDRFLVADSQHARFFAPGTAARWQFDLPGFLRHRLTACGVGSVEDLACCTYEQESAFFSYRRATHRKEPDYGRQLSAIALT
jgi:hypothetical protein